MFLLSEGPLPMRESGRASLLLGKRCLTEYQVERRHSWVCEAVTPRAEHSIN